MKFLPYGHQSITSADIQAVAKALKSDWLTQGPGVEAFEKKLAHYCGAKYAVAVNSGTAALHLACTAAGLKKGNQAITSPITFVSTANAVLFTGAKPVFADIDPETINIDPDQIQKKVTKKTKVIMPVHYAGLPCDMKRISKIAKKKNIRVIEDASHALGAKYTVNRRSYKVGSCSHSDLTTFSFHPIKHITTGEGGAITTNNKEYYGRMLQLRNHGAVRNRTMLAKKPWAYEMQSLGFNYRVSDFQCALGASQLKRLNTMVQKRRQLAKMYHDCFAEFEGVSTIKDQRGYLNSYHIVVVQIRFTKFKTTRARVMKYLRQKGIGTQVHYIPVFQQPYYRKLGYKQSACPKAKKFYQQALTLPLYPDMSKSDVKYVSKTLINYLN